MNKVVSFQCSSCGSTYHSRCIWGQFYYVDESFQKRDGLSESFKEVEALSSPSTEVFPPQEFSLQLSESGSDEVPQLDIPELSPTDISPQLPLPDIPPSSLTEVALAEFPPTEVAPSEAPPSEAPPTNTISTAHPTRFWLCPLCLVHKHIELFDDDLKEWISVYVVGYHPSSNQHAIKRQQNIVLLHLGQYRVRLMRQTDNTEAHIENTPTNASVIEIDNGIRKYRYSQSDCFEMMNYHNQPQIV